MTSTDSTSATSSPASADGPTPSASQAGPTTGLFGQVVAPASRSAQRAVETPLTTKGTYGPSSRGSSASAELQWSLENRLRQRMAAYGSPEYALTWKHWDIQWGPPICALRASARRTSGSGCGGWPTPSAATFNDGQSAESNQARRDRLKAKHKNGNGAGMTLGGAAQLAAGWPTPVVGDANGARSMTSGRSKGSKFSPGLNLSDLAYMGWPTPNCNTRGPESSDSKATRPKAGGIDLQSMAMTVGWCSPTSRDHRDTPGMATARPDGKPRFDHLPRQAHGATPISSPAETGTRGVLDPALPRWLMGYPEAWDRTAPGSSEWTSAQQRETERRG